MTQHTEQLVHTADRRPVHTRPTSLLPKGALMARVTFTADEVRVTIGRNTADFTVPLASACYAPSGASWTDQAVAVVRAEGFEVVHGPIPTHHGDTPPEDCAALVALVRPTRPNERPGVEGPTWDGGRGPSYARLVQHVQAAVSDVLGDVLGDGTLDAVTDRLTERLRAADYLR